MPKVSNTDATVAGSSVQVTLKVIGDAQSDVKQVYHGEIDADGYWEMDLVPNRYLLPEATYYEVIEDPGGSAVTTNILVPAALGVEGTLDIDSHTISTSLTAKDTSVVDTTYGQAEVDVITNNRTRIEELEEYLGL